MQRRVSKLGVVGLCCSGVSLMICLVVGSGPTPLLVAMVGFVLSAAALLSLLVAEDVGPRVPNAAMAVSVVALLLPLATPWSAADNAARQRDVGLPPSLPPTSGPSAIGS